MTLRRVPKPPLPPMQTYTVVTREVTYRTVKVRARTVEAAIERADSTDDEDTYTEGDGVESVTDEQGNDVTPAPAEDPYPRSVELAAILEWFAADKFEGVVTDAVDAVPGVLPYCEDYDRGRMPGRHRLYQAMAALDAWAADRVEAATERLRTLAAHA